MKRRCIRDGIGMVRGWDNSCRQCLFLSHYKGREGIIVVDDIYFYRILRDGMRTGREWDGKEKRMIPVPYTILLCLFMYTVYIYI